MFLYKIWVSPLESILGHGRYKDELIQALSQDGISLKESLVLLKRDLTRVLTHLSVRHLILIELFHNDQVLWQRLKARVGQWILRIEGVRKFLGR